MGYYFNYKRNEGCYHLEKIKMYVELGKYRTIVYRDEDYSDFAKKIVNETINELRRSSNI
jgi:predicted nucleic acid-binding Zn finger protein